MSRPSAAENSVVWQTGFRANIILYALIPFFYSLNELQCHKGAESTFFTTKFFYDKNFFTTKIFTPKFFTPIFFSPKQPILRQKDFLRQKLFLRQKTFFTPIFFKKIFFENWRKKVWA